MIRKIFTLTLVALFVMTSLRAETIDDILAKVMKASGGDKFKAVKTIKMTGSMNMMGMDMPFTIYNKKPAFRMEQEMMGQKVVSAFDGTKGWMINPMGGGDPQEMPDEMVKNAKQQASFGENPLLTMKENGVTPTLIGKEKADDKDCWKIKLESKDNPETYLYLDASTYLLHKMTSNVEAMGQKQDVTIYFKDYKAFDGITMVTSMEMNAAGQTINIKFDKIEPNIPIDDSLFKMPTK